MSSGNTYPSPGSGRILKGVAPQPGWECPSLHSLPSWVPESLRGPSRPLAMTLGEWEGPQVASQGASENSGILWCWEGPLGTPLSLVQCSMPGLPVHHQLPEFTQTHVYRVSDAIQPSHPLTSPSPPALNLSQHQGLMVPAWAAQCSEGPLADSQQENRGHKATTTRH